MQHTHSQNHHSPHTDTAKINTQNQAHLDSHIRHDLMVLIIIFVIILFSVGMCAIIFGKVLGQIGMFPKRLIEELESQTPKVTPYPTYDYMYTPTPIEFDDEWYY